MKRKLIIIICFVFVFITTFGTLGLARGQNNVFAASDYEVNLFGRSINSVSVLNATYEITDTSCIVTTERIGGSASRVFCWLDLFPYMDYVLTYTAIGDYNRVIVYDSNVEIISDVIGGNTINFRTDSVGRTRISFWSCSGAPDKIYTTEYSNICLSFANETLNEILDEVYTKGYSDGTSIIDGYADGYADGYDEGYTVGYEDGYNDGYLEGGGRIWLPITSTGTAVEWFYADEGRWESFPRINGINPFGNTSLNLLPGTYRISFIDKTSGFYPLMYDFGGVVFEGFTYNVITPIYTAVPPSSFGEFSFSSKYRVEVYNTSGSPYSFDDARSYEPIIFTLPPSKATTYGYVSVHFYMMRCDKSFNFVHWSSDIAPDVFDLCTIEMLEPVDNYDLGYEEGYEEGYENGFDDGSSAGYNRGHNEGYQKGYNAGLSGTINTNWFIAFLNSIFDILNIEVFPNIKIVYLLFIPIGLGVLALIFKLVRG